MENLPGLIPDPRLNELKAKDYQHEEVVSTAIPLKWNRDISGAPIYYDKDQNGGGYCVAEGSSTGLETIRGEIVSAHPIYARRTNAPGVGMWLQDAGDIVHRLVDGGTTTEALDPSQRMTEKQISRPVEVLTPINSYLYFFVNVADIDAIATAIETQKHCIITINGNIQEYAYSEKPVVISGAPLNCAHCICGIYYFTDSNGEKCILIKESWGPNNIRLRTLTETYLKSRGTGAMYFIPPIEPDPVPKPKYHFSVPLLYDQSSYGIKMLQDILKYENLFPMNVPSSGKYLEITRKGVMNWQLKYQVAPIEEINALQGRRVGLKTIKELNKIYG